jgi:hypothetical protein
VLATTPAPDLDFVILVPLAGLLVCAAIGGAIFGLWSRIRRR